MDYASKLYFLQGVPLDNSYTDTLWFDSVGAQTAAFQAKAVAQLIDLWYVRKGLNGYADISTPISTIQGCNYVMYQNTSYSDKWYYAFLTNIEYLNDGTTRIYFETDVIQTYLFDFEFKASMVEREHVMDDTIGLHTYPEGLEVGEYELDHENDSGVLEPSDCVVVMLTSVDPNNPNVIAGSMFQKQYWGCFINVFSDATGVNDALDKLTEAGKADGVIALYMVPKSMYNLWSSGSQIGYAEFSQTKYTTSLGTYTPKNNKLFCYPYNFMYVINNCGASAIYPYENFYISGNSVTFRIYGDITPNPSVYIVPTDYLKQSFNYNEKFSLSGFPQCAYNINTYKSWVAQNFGNISANLVSNALNGAMGVVGGVASGNPVKAATAPIDAMENVFSLVAQAHDVSVLPPQSKGTLATSVTYSAGLLDFFFYQAHIKPEYAQIIDSFFDMFGYKVMTVKEPNRNGRAHWNYVKVPDPKITGNVPYNFLSEIKRIHSNGITYWKNMGEVGDYSLDNSLS